MPFQNGGILVSSRQILFDDQKMGIYSFPQTPDADGFPQSDPRACTGLPNRGW